MSAASGPFSALGRALSDLSPSERGHVERFRTTVTENAAGIAREYANEIQPYIGAIDLELLFTLIDRNVLRAVDLERIYHAYDAAAAPPEPAHVFCMLFRAGLLGWVDVDLARHLPVQKFLLPGERAFTHTDALPEAGCAGFKPTSVDRDRFDYIQEIVCSWKQHTLYRRPTTWTL